LFGKKGFLQKMGSVDVKGDARILKNKDLFEIFIYSGEFKNKFFKMRRNVVQDRILIFIIIL